MHITGKDYYEWSRLTKTKAYLDALSKKQHTGNARLLIETIKDGDMECRGTWGDRKIAIRFAQWCSPDFAVQVDTWIEELLTKGLVTLNQEPIIQLPPVDIRITSLVSTLEKLGVDLTNPRFNQELKDLALDMIVGQKQLPASNEQWCGVAERAEQLGYPVAVVTKNRSQLGKYVKSFNLTSRMEERLCNGTQRPINLYLVCDDLDTAIKEFMDAKVLANSLK